MKNINSKNILSQIEEDTSYFSNKIESFLDNYVKKNNIDKEFFNKHLKIIFINQEKIEIIYMNKKIKTFNVNYEKRSI